MWPGDWIWQSEKGTVTVSVTSLQLQLDLGHAPESFAGCCCNVPACSNLGDHRANAPEGVGGPWRKHHGPAKAATEDQPCIGKRRLHMESSGCKTFRKKNLETSPSQKGWCACLYQAEGLDWKAGSTQ